MSERKNDMPSGKEEMDALRMKLRAELGPEALDTITGGNDDEKGDSDELWTCPHCGQTIQLKKKQDKAKHSVKCPMKP